VNGEVGQQRRDRITGDDANQAADTQRKPRERDEQPGARGLVARSRQMQPV